MTISANSINRMRTQPIATPRSNRVHDLRVLTSLPAGRMVPLAVMPLLREDSVRTGRFRFSFEMMETAEILMNAIHVDVKAYLVPWLAMDRFNGMDQFNRSYEGVPEREGGETIPFVETHAFGATDDNDVYRYLGLHAKATTQVNTMYLEAYNQIWNFRAKNRSPDITLRDRLETDLAPAFWKHQTFAHIVPDFDQAVIDGQVPLNVTNAQLPVKGIGLRNQTYENSVTSYETGETGPTLYTRGRSSNDAAFNLREDPNNPGFPAIYAEMQQNGITVSLSNIELAKQTAAFARLRQQYAGHNDDYIVSLLMDGITVPEQALQQPMLIAEKSTIFGMSKRYASDSGNLTESVVNGMTSVDLAISLPKIQTGGVVMFIAEITPEQLFERQKDPFLHLGSVDELPQYLRDTLDPEKVSVVTNDYVDIDHDTPNATFGYAPLNHEWNITAPKIGGRFIRPEVDEGFDEDRQRIWAVETQNPTLSEDFYLCTNMHTKPFVVTNQDPFEVVGRGTAIINGNTVFGGMLIEASDDYETILAEAPQERIEKA